MTFDLGGLSNVNTEPNLSVKSPATELSSTETLQLFMRTYRDIYTEMEARLSQFGITQGRFMLLKILHRKNSEYLTPSVLAEQAGVSRGTVSGLIDGLERDGLIERKRQQDSDRRIVTVQLTEAGWMVMDQLLPHYTKGIDMLMSEFTGEDRVVLVSLMEKMQIGLKKIKNQLDDLK